MSTGFVPKPRTRQIDFKGTEYEGLEVTIITSCPYGVLDDLQSGDTNTFLAALATIIVDWNLCDMQTGEPLGAPSVESMRRVPMDLSIGLMLRSIETIQGALTQGNVPRPSESSS